MNLNNMGRDFFEELTGFRDFKGITDQTNFVTVPGDWLIVITDVVKSTRAISAGKYRDVNTIGAATIVQASKLMRHRKFPFSFGGDGAIIIVPPEVKDPLIQRLCGLREISGSQFDLDLRVGFVVVEELQDRGYKVEVAKYEETKGSPVAILRGDGISYAEQWIKEYPELYQTELSEKETQHPDLDGLSCRWQPIPAHRGKIVSLLVQSQYNDSEVYSRILTQLGKILPEGIDAHNPVNRELMTYKSVRENLKNERRYHKSLASLSFLKRIIEIVLSVFVFKFKLPAVVFDPGKYLSSVRFHTDFKKFDDMLRMTIDCSADQIERIKQVLEERHQAGEIFYGIFETDKALMTCFIEEGMGEGEHYHFIDAENGGYSEAAVGLKKQLRESAK